MSASGLRAKLNSMKTAQALPERKSLGLRSIRYDEAADDALYKLSEAALSRMGFQGGISDIEDVLFIDTETTGLSGGAGTVAFLTGVGYVKNGRFYVEQYLMRDYADEVEMLNLVSLKLNTYQYLVSFNGRSFDMPLLKGRFTLQRMQGAYRELEHLDLLFPSRRLWKRRLGNCKLSTLEDQILRRGRVDDLPGSEVPQRFFDYLKTGDEALLEDVLFHNRLDIISLGALLVALSAAYERPTGQRETADLFSMGRVLENMGDKQGAEDCFELAIKPKSVLSIQALRDTRYADEARRALALIHKKRGDFERALPIFHRLSQGGQFSIWAKIEIAKHYEHRLKDHESALNIAREALDLAKDDQREMALIERRIARLHRKLEG